METDPRRHGMRYRHMRHAVFAEERAFAVKGAIDELVNEDEGAGREFLLERAAGRQRNEVGHAGALQHVDIGAIVDVARRQPVAVVVARHERDRQSVDVAEAKRRRWGAPRARDQLLAHILEARQVVETRAADYPKHRFDHASPVMPKMRASGRARTAGRNSFADIDIEHVPYPVPCLGSLPSTLLRAALDESDQISPCCPIPSGTPSSESARIQSEPSSTMSRGVSASLPASA